MRFFLIKFLSLVSMLSLSSAFAADCVFPYINYSPRELKIREAWRPENFTDVARHNPQQFMYLVHKIDLRTRFETRIPRNSWTYKLLLNPESIADSLRISATVITHFQMATAFAPHARIGFVLSADCRLIGPAEPFDMGTTRPRNLEEAPDIWRELYSHYPNVYSPGQIASARRGSYYYSEVTLIGSLPTDANVKTEVKAVVVECTARKLDLHGGTIKKWSGKRGDLYSCLEGYPARNDVMASLMKLGEKYPVLLKVALPFSQL